VLPAVLVLISGRVQGRDPALRFFAALLASWLGFVAFMVVTTLERQRRAETLRRARALPARRISDHSPA
jgi:hypothetical protein